MIRERLRRWLDREDDGAGEYYVYGSPWGRSE